MQRADRGSAISTGRLSSGLKINRSSDDPAGMAISNKIWMQSGGTEQASRNSSNIMSMLHTADGALNEVHAMLGRIQTLTVQAANDTNVLEDKVMIQQEINQIISEINEISIKTEFNTMRLIGGEAGRLVFASAAQPNIHVISNSYNLPFGTFTFDIMALPTHTTLLTGAGDPLPNNDLHDQIITINGVQLHLHAQDDAASLRMKLADVLAASSFQLTSAPAPSLFGEIQAVYSGSRRVLDISGSPAVLAALGLDGTPTPGTDAELDNFGGIFGPDSLGNITTVYNSDGNLLNIVGPGGERIRLELRPGVTLGEAEITTRPGPMLAQTGANFDTNFRMEIPRVNAIMLGIDRINVQSHDLGQEAIAISYAAITLASEVRARIGAYSNRLEHTISGLDIAAVDLQHALSRIRDTDMALEMAEYSKYQVVYQAGMAILAQANARPQQILQLIQ